MCDHLTVQLSQLWGNQIRENDAFTAAVVLVLYFFVIKLSGSNSKQQVILMWKWLFRAADVSVGSSWTGRPPRKDLLCHVRLWRLASDPHVPASPGSEWLEFGICPSGTPSGGSLAVMGVVLHVVKPKDGMQWGKTWGLSRFMLFI